MTCHEVAIINICYIFVMQAYLSAVEKAMYDQVYNYLLENDLINENHHGFLKHHSTSTALQQLIDIWLKAADQGKISAAVLLDLSAGFDLVNHDILL